MQPIACPLCNRRSLEPVLEAVTMFARLDGEQQVSGLRAFRCTQLGHLFFITIRDIEEPLTEPKSSKPCSVCRGTGECTVCSGTGKMPWSATR